VSEMSTIRELLDNGEADKALGRLLSTISHAKAPKQYCEDLLLVKSEIDKLKAELKADEKENAILNQTLKLMAARAQNHLCPDEDDCVDEGDCVLHEDAVEQDCIRCWLDYFRAKVEKGK